MVSMAKSWSPPKDEINKVQKIHGPYTEGFYEDEMNQLFKDVKKP